MSTRTVVRSSKELDSAIEALASAGHTLQLTPFAHFAYRALMVSADAVVAVFFVNLLVVLPPIILDLGVPFDSYSNFVQAIEVVYRAILVFGVVSLAMNIPLFSRASRERARLKRSGLSSLSDSLWRESRRSRWTSRIRAALLLAVGLLNILALLLVISGYFIARYFGDELEPSPRPEDLEHLEPMVYAMLAIVLFAVSLVFGAQYLRSQRERIELTANADELRNALRSLQEHAGAGKVPVPVELLEQTAKIELAQIATQRKDAVLQGIAFRPNAYAITFDPDAAGSRAALDMADRVELEDLLADLSTEGRQLAPQSDGTGAVPFRFRTKNNRVAIDCLLDQGSQNIRIVSVRHETAATPSASGVTYA